MTMIKKALFVISLLLAILIIVPVICAQYITPVTLSPKSDYTDFDHPSGIAVDSMGNIYVTSDLSDSIWKFSPSGEVITRWGSSGSGEGQFSNPLNIAIDGQNFIYVTDFFNHRIQKFSSDGTYISHWIFFKNAPDECIRSGSEPPSNLCRGHSLGGIAAGTDGNLYIVDRSNNSIYKTTPDGKFLARVGSDGAKNGQFDTPSDIAFDREGNFFVADYGNSRVQKFSANGTFLSSFGSAGTGDGQFSTPGGIGVDRMGFVYVTDTGLNRVQKFTNSGIFVRKWGMKGIKNGEFSYPHDVAVDGNDNVYVTDFGNNNIQKFSANGSFLMKWGGTPAPRTMAVPLPTLTPDPNRTPNTCEEDSTMNVTNYLEYANEKLHWDFSDQQIIQFSEKLQNSIEIKDKPAKDWIHFCSFSKFSEDLRDTIGITEEQRIALLYYERKSMMDGFISGENPDFKPTDTPHFVISGKVTDTEGRPVPDAIVKFESDLVVLKTPLMNWVADDTLLSSTTRTGTDGTYHINIAWGDRQNASVIKVGYLNTTRSNINLSKENNTINFQLTPQPRQTASAPGFLFLPVVTAIILVCLLARKRYQ